MKEKKLWLLYDGRYLTDKDSAIVYEHCNSLSEAKSSASDYGTDTVIVEATLKGKELINHKII